MAEWGSNPEELTALGKDLVVQAERVDGIRGGLSVRLQLTTWRGSDADRTRTEWTNRHVRLLQEVAEVLRAAGHQLQTEAKQQNEASAAETSRERAWDMTVGAHELWEGVHNRLEYLQDLGDYLADTKYGEKLAGAVGKEFAEHFPAAEATLGHAMSAVHDVAANAKVAKGLEVLGKVAGVVSVASDVVGVADGINKGDWGEVTTSVLDLGLTAASRTPVGAGIKFGYDTVMFVDGLTGNHVQHFVGDVAHAAVEHAGSFFKSMFGK